MNDSFEEVPQAVGYMSLSNQEKSELVFRDIKNSYIFWQVKKAIKDEIVKSKGKPGDIVEMIPKLLGDLNLETKIKNKVHEILDCNGYFRDCAQVAATKFKNCSDIEMIPPYFFDREHEPLEAVATAKQQWSEHLKHRMNLVVRQSRRPFIRLKKQAKAAAEAESKAEGEELPQPSEQPFVYDSTMLLDAILKINTVNFSGNPMLSWGQVKLQL